MLRPGKSCRHQKKKSQISNQTRDDLNVCISGFIILCLMCALFLQHSAHQYILRYLSPLQAFLYGFPSSMFSVFTSYDLRLVFLAFSR